MAGTRKGDAEISNKDTQEIMGLMWHPSVKDDLYKWVMLAFPWGQENTPLATIKGPRKWQKDELDRISAHIAANKARMAMDLTPEVYRSATTSGRGPGKSALVAWINLWFMSCVIGGSSIVTANTQTQLVSKTFSEIGKWHTLCLSGYWFERSQTKLAPKPWFAELCRKQLKIDAQYYYADGVLWNEDEPDSFAGAHNENGMLLTMDEASGIPQKIWTVSEGFFTDISAYRFWFAFSNPRSNTGAFFECFHRYRNYWNTRKIDSRDVEGLDRKVYDDIIAKFGEDSDEARIEVKGDFPKQGDSQFISRGLVDDARARTLERYDDYAALVMGVDPARFGDDSTVISFRRGRDARSVPSVVLKGADNMRVANLVAELIDQKAPDAVFIDSGAGAGIIDRLKERGYKVIEVGFGTASEDETYADHRTELWARMREWISGAMLPDDDELRDDLCGPEYEFTNREKIKLEAKEKMKKRGLHSPDRADALALTFHAKVARKDNSLSRTGSAGRSRQVKGRDYKLF